MSELPESDNMGARFTDPKVTLFQSIPAGRVSTYAEMARALASSPRAVGGALRRNPFAPEVPCHRIVQANGYIGGFNGEWNKAPSGVNCHKKKELLRAEGVEFNDAGFLKNQDCLWNEFDVSDLKFGAIESK